MFGYIKIAGSDIENIKGNCIARSILHLFFRAPIKTGTLKKKTLSQGLIDAYSRYST